MSKKCEYCGQENADNSKYCIGCGAKLSNEPSTIEELRDYCAKNLSGTNASHFHIGENYAGSKAFGIYQNDAGEFVVYKNKANGEQAIRYQGYDESYAVNELYQKMKEFSNSTESNTQNSNTTLNNFSNYSSAASSNYGMSSYDPSKVSQKSASTLTSKDWLVVGLIGLGVILVIVFLVVCVFLPGSPSNGYYRYGDTWYYYDSGTWYIEDYNKQDWNVLEQVDPELKDHYSEYYFSMDYPNPLDYDVVEYTTSNYNPSTYTYPSVDYDDYDDYYNDYNYNYDTYDDYDSYYSYDDSDYSSYSYDDSSYSSYDYSYDSTDSYDWDSDW